MPSASTWWNGTSSRARVSWSRGLASRRAAAGAARVAILELGRVDAQLARAVEREHALDVDVLAAVGDERGNLAPHDLAQLARAPGARVAAQLERLAVGQQQDRRHRLAEVEHAA